MYMVQVNLSPPIQMKEGEEARVKRSQLEHNSKTNMEVYKSQSNRANQILAIRIQEFSAKANA